jgi:CubicO group peptidase (beta-lactamase class C family)
MWVIAVLTVATLIPQPVVARNKGREIDQLLQKYHEYHQFNGAALVTESGQVILQKGYGQANIEWDVPNTTTTKFRLGSLTKQFTAVLVLQLIDEGKLGLYDKITDHVDEYPNAGDRISIHHLLTHASGIPDYTTIPGFITDDIRDPQAPETIMRSFAPLELEFEPGDGFRYSNSNYFVLGIIIERITGKRFGQVLDERILEPYKLDDTGYDDGTIVLNNRAQGYESQIMEYVNARHIDMSTAYSSAGMYSTVEDLFKWDRILYGDKLFKEPTYKDLMFTPYGENYGYGWSVVRQQIGSTDKMTKIVQHGGGLFGFSSTMWRMVDDEHTIILLDNTSTPGRLLRGMAERIFNILYEQPYDKPLHPVGRKLMAVIDQQGVERAVRTYRDLKEKDADVYDFSERELNILGYHYLREDDTATAIEVFKLNVEAYPDAFNPYDSLGEGYMVAGQMELAIENYRKSLELNPRNDNARRMLTRMGVDPSGREEITLPPEILERYVGDYEMQPGIIITITREGDHLMASAGNQPPAQLYAESETTFFFRVIDAEISFQIRPDGTAEQLTLYQNGMSVPAVRIE